MDWPTCTQDNLDESNFLNEEVQVLIDHTYLLELESWEAQEDLAVWYRIVVTYFQDRDYFLNESPTRVLNCATVLDIKFTSEQEARDVFWSLVRQKERME